MEYCACITNHKGEWRVRLLDIWDEVLELIEVKTWDEFLDEWSDVVFGVGRLLGYYWGVQYLSLYGDERHVAKITKRMMEYGCVRSRRHLVDNRCCSLCK